MFSNVFLGPTIVNHYFRCLFRCNHCKRLSPEYFDCALLSDDSNVTLWLNTQERWFNGISTFFVFQFFIQHFWGDSPRIGLTALCWGPLACSGHWPWWTATGEAASCRPSPGPANVFVSGEKTLFVAKQERLVNSRLALKETWIERSEYTKFCLKEKKKRGLLSDTATLLTVVKVAPSASTILSSSSCGNLGSEFQ